MPSRNLALVKTDAPRKHFHRPEIDRLDASFIRPVINILILRRHAMKLTQSELEFRIGAPDNHLAKWEAGMHRPSLYFFLLWCEALEYRLKLVDQTSVIL